MLSSPVTQLKTEINSREIPASEKTALEAVMEADEERIKLEALAEMLALETDDASQEYLMQVFDNLRMSVQLITDSFRCMND